MDAKQIIQSRLLPKTGQTTSFETGDDGDLEVGWWKGLSLSANKTRLVVLIISAKFVIVDRATGLVWARDGNDAGGNNGSVINWSDAISYALGLNFAGFTDWRIPNVLELASILDYEKTIAPLAYWEFTNIVTGNHWSSTTQASLTTQAFQVSFSGGIIAYTAKTATRNILCVRGGV